MRKNSEQKLAVSHDPQKLEDDITQIIWDFTNGRRGGRMCRSAARYIISKFFITDTADLSSSTAPAGPQKEK